MKNAAFLFPGQGSQKPGMLDAFLGHSYTEKYFETANSILGYDLRALCEKEGSAEDLKQTAKAQPAILTTSFLAFSIFMDHNPDFTPQFSAGHSLGEYTALLCAGVFSFEDALFLVHNRGTFMQQACSKEVGGMVAVLGKTQQEVQKACEEVAEGECLQPANFNCPGQIVVAGHKKALQRLLKKVKGVELEVSVPFHCPLLSPVKEQMEKVMEKVSFHNPKWPVVNNAKNQFLKTAEEVKLGLIEQITAPVLWQTGVEKMIEQGVKIFFEFGNGRVLTNLNKRISSQVENFNIDSLEKGQQKYSL